MPMPSLRKRTGTRHFFACAAAISLRQLLHPERDLRRVGARLVGRGRQLQGDRADRVGLPAEARLEGRDRVVGLDAGGIFGSVTVVAFVSSSSFAGAPGSVWKTR